jgi:uncharacterized membrane protein YbhN (UPF0104 family)
MSRSSRFLGWLRRTVPNLAARLGRLRERGTGSLRTRRIVLAISSVAFIASMIIAFLTLPDEGREVGWLPLVLVGVVGVPAMMALNAAEYAASGRVLGYHIRLLPALRVAVVASAANLLPLPGSVLVRSHALKQEGSSYGRAFGITTAIGLMWLGAGCLLAGLFQAWAGAWHLAGPLFAVGAVGALACHLTVRALCVSGTPARHTLVIMLIEAGMIMVKALRFHLVLMGLGLDTPFGGSVALTLSGILAAALGFFPGGLGIRELLAAAIGPLVDIQASAALLAAGLDRLVSLPVLAIVAGILAIRGERAASPEPEPAPETDDKLA